MTPDQQTKLSEALSAKQHLLSIETFGGAESSEALIKAQSFSGRISSMVLEITDAQLYAWAVDGMPIQRAMSNLSPEEREFLMSGTRQDEWDAMFSEAE